MRAARADSLAGNSLSGARRGRSHVDQRERRRHRRGVALGQVLGLFNHDVHVFCRAKGQLAHALLGLGAKLIDVAANRVEIDLHKQLDGGQWEFKGQGLLIDPARAPGDTPTAVSGRFLLRPVQVRECALTT